MAHEENRPALLECRLVHAAEAFLLEGRVAHGEHLIHDENVGLQVRRHGKGQPHIHAAGISFDRRIDELSDFGELHDPVELLGHLGARHAEDGAVEINVLAAGQLAVETGADLEQTGQLSAQTELSARRCCDLADHFEQGRFARAVATDDSDYLALIDRKRDVAKSPEGFAGGVVRFRLMAHLAVRVLQTAHSGPPALHILVEHAAADHAEAVALAEFGDLKDGRHQIVSQKVRSVRRKIMMPATKITRLTAAPASNWGISTVPAPRNAKRKVSMTGTMGLRTSSHRTLSG